MIEAGKYTVVPEDVVTHIPVEIGAFTSIASGLTIVSGQHPPIQNPSCVSTFPFYEWGWGEYTPSKHHGKVIIGSDVWIGQNVTILEDVVINHGAIIGAGSVVTKDVKPYRVVAGNPAKFIRTRFMDMDIEILLKMKWWEWDDEIIKEILSTMTDINKFVAHYHE